jgi:hypothetical protein
MNTVIWKDCHGHIHTMCFDDDDVEHANSTFCYLESQGLSVTIAHNDVERDQFIGNSEEQTKPNVVCLCGSTRFMDAYTIATREETLKGHIVLTVGLFGHAEGMDMNGSIKKMLDELHLRKIDMADEIFVLNVDGYVGQSTSKEIEYAKEKGKGVRFLEPLDVNYNAIASA